MAFVIFGRNIPGGATAFGDIQLSASVLPADVGFRIIGAIAYDEIGRCVSAAGDVNGDGIGDIIIGAPSADPPSGSNAGVSYVIFGRNVAGGAAAFEHIQLTTGALSATVGFRILGAASGDESGFSVSGAGDINSDGVADLLVGASLADPPGKAGAGISYIIYGRKIAAGAAPFGDIQLTTTTSMSATIGFRLIGGSSSDDCGFSVSAAGDINGDGVADVIVGAQYADPSGSQLDAGISYVVFGTPPPPTSQPSSQPSQQPSRQPTTQPSHPSSQPTRQPTAVPSCQPSAQPSRQPTRQPSDQPSRQPSGHPSAQPTRQLSVHPSHQPSAQPSHQPASLPSSQPSTQPTCQPRNHPSTQPSNQPSRQPSRQPSSQPSSQPVAYPTTQPSAQPVSKPSTQPSCQPSRQPSFQPVSAPSAQPSLQPTCRPSVLPSVQPSVQPSSQPSLHPSAQPSHQPTRQPSSQPSRMPSARPSVQPTAHPSIRPSSQPSNVPSDQPTAQPTTQPSEKPISQPTSLPSVQPSMQPSDAPSTQPSAQPTTVPSTQPSSVPTLCPSSQPSVQPSTQPTFSPSMQISDMPTMQPSGQPSRQPTDNPTAQPPITPTTHPSDQPSSRPTLQPSSAPSGQPTYKPSAQPSTIPTMQPSPQATVPPTPAPTYPHSLFPTTNFPVVLSSMPTATNVWVTYINNTQQLSIFVVRDSLWACSASITERSMKSFCIKMDPARGTQLASITLPYYHITSMLESTIGPTSIIVAGTFVAADSVSTDIASCRMDDAQYTCSARSFDDTMFVAGSDVPAVSKHVYIGAYNAQLSVSVLSSTINTNTISSYRYTFTNMKTVEFSHTQSPPNYLGSFVAGVCSSVASLHYICAGVVRTDSGVITAMYLTQTSGTILNSAELVNAMALDYVNPDSFIAGGLELNDGAGMHAYLLRVNSLYNSVLYAMRFRINTAIRNGRRALQQTQAIRSVTKGMALIDNVLYMVLEYLLQDSALSNVAVLKVHTVTRQIIQQVQIHSSANSLSCTGITSAGFHLFLSCAEKIDSAHSRAYIFSMNRDLTLSQLPVGFRRYENNTFTSERVTFHRTMLPIMTQSANRPTRDYIFTTTVSSATVDPSVTPTPHPSAQKSSAPSGQPSSSPTAAPSVSPQPTSQPSSSGPTNTYKPTAKPTQRPSTIPSTAPTKTPTVEPTLTPTARPTTAPSISPCIPPSISPTALPTRCPSNKPTRNPSGKPTMLPSGEHSVTPTISLTSATEVLAKAPSEDRSHLIVGYIAAGLLGLWLLYALRRWCQYKLEGVQSDANRTLYVGSMGEKAKPRFPIVAYIVSLFCTIQGVEIDFVSTERNASNSARAENYNGTGANVEGPDLEANIVVPKVCNRLEGRENDEQPLVGVAEQSITAAADSNADATDSSIGSAVGSSSDERSEGDVILFDESSYDGEFYSALGDLEGYNASTGNEEEYSGSDSVLYSLSGDASNRSHSLSHISNEF